MTKTKTHKKMSIAILTTLIATTMAFSVSAGNRKGSALGHQRGARGFPMLAQLNLTDAQQKKVDTLTKKKRTEIDTVKKEMDQLRDQVRTQWEKDPVDKNKVKSLHKRMQSLHTKIADARLNYRLSVYDVLTPEQRKKAAAERKIRHQNRSWRRQNRGDGANFNGGERGDGCGRGNGKGKGRGRGRGNG